MGSAGDDTDAESVPSREALSERGTLVVDFRRVARRVSRADDDDEIDVDDAMNDTDMLTPLGRARRWVCEARSDVATRVWNGFCARLQKW